MTVSNAVSAHRTMGRVRRRRAAGARAFESRWQAVGWDGRGPWVHVPDDPGVSEPKVEVLPESPSLRSPDGALLRFVGNGAEKEGVEPNQKRPPGACDLCVR